MGKGEVVFENVGTVWRLEMRMKNEIGGIRHAGDWLRMKR